MTATSYLPLQQAIYSALTGNAPLMALVTGVYDHVPQDTPYPYMVLGDPLVQDVSNMKDSQLAVSIPLTIWSREGGRKETGALSEMVHALLHEAMLTLTGQTLISLRVSRMNTDRMNDGITYRAQMDCDALVRVGV